MGLLSIYANSFRGLSREAWMLSIVMLINRAGSMVLPFLGVYMTDELGFSIKESGIVLSFYGIGSIIGSWLGGFLTDKYDEYRVQSMSLFLSAPLFLLIPFFPTVMGMATIILIQSAISETFRPANSVAITKYARPGNLTRAFSLNRMAVNLGFSVGPAMGGILSAISYEFLFVTNAVAAVVAGFVYVRFFKRRHKIYKYRQLRKERAEKETPKEKGRSPYRDFMFIVFTVFCGFFAIFFFQFFNTIPIFYKEVVGLDQQTIGYILGYSGFIIALFEMLIVTWADKYLTLARTLLLGALLVAASYGMLVFNHGLLIIILSMTVLSLSEILVLPFMSTITALRSGSGMQGAYMGLNGMAFSVSFVITPLLGTAIAQEHGFDTLWIVSTVALIVTGVGLYRIVKKMLPAQ